MAKGDKRSSVSCKREVENGEKAGFEQNDGGRDAAGRAVVAMVVAEFSTAISGPPAVTGDNRREG
ncbi:MAG TPA: hypothetical protein VFC38_02560 [Stellaceae bacterium]|nr:hypothetical protein [Stellaceae bacterium]